jgi:hypothetical protein
MAKYRVKMKLTGFELEIEGTREDMPVIAQSLGQQLSGLLGPASQIIEGEVVRDEPMVAPNATAGAAGDSTNRRKVRRKSSRTQSGTALGAASPSSSETAVQWRHDTSKYGSPRQDWGGTKKALWLLYVAGAEANVREMSGARIAMTSNTHFRTAGQLRTHNVNRDLAKLKVARSGEPPLVSEDTTKSPPAWFLTDAGTKAAQRLVAEALGEAGK